MHRSARRTLLIAGLVIWLAGLLVATLIYVWVAVHSCDAQLTTLPLGPHDEFDIERLGGRATVYAVRLNRWLGSLWHGRTLAYTIAGLSTVAAAICGWIADGVADPATLPTPEAPLAGRPD